MPAGVEEFVRMCTSSYGKVKLVLKHNKYYLETAHLDVLQSLLKDPVLSSARFQGYESILIGEEDFVLKNNSPSFIWNVYLY